VDLPTSLYRLHGLKEFSIDWISYLHSSKIRQQTKILQGLTSDFVEKQNGLEDPDSQLVERKNHQEVI